MPDVDSVLERTAKGVHGIKDVAYGVVDSLRGGVKFHSVENNGKKVRDEAEKGELTFTSLADLMRVLREDRLERMRLGKFEGLDKLKLGEGTEAENAKAKEMLAAQYNANFWEQSLTVLNALRIPGPTFISGGMRKLVARSVLRQLGEGVRADSNWGNPLRWEPNGELTNKFYPDNMGKDDEFKYSPLDREVMYLFRVKTFKRELNDDGDFLDVVLDQGKDAVDNLRVAYMS